jgi:hypothetical protein
MTLNQRLIMTLRRKEGSIKRRTMMVMMLSPPGDPADDGGERAAPHGAAMHGARHIHCLLLLHQ